MAEGSAHVRTEKQATGAAPPLFISASIMMPAYLADFAVSIAGVRLAFEVDRMHIA
tara:strand:+ start:146 stop:313 length:168 start_codon:yes stop_codon:yes gene_type:complete